MFKQIILPILACIVFIIVVGIFVQRIDGKKVINFFGSPKASSNSINTKIVKVAGHEVKAEIARSEKDRQKGLSGRASLPEDGGMLFVFEKKNTTPSFWMKDMLIPLDLIWIRDGKIAKIDKNVPIEKDTPDNKLKIYSIETPVDYILEVNAGYSDKIGIKVGDSVEIPNLD